MISRITRTKTRRLGLEMQGDGFIVVAKSELFVRRGYKRGAWETTQLCLDPNETVKLCSILAEKIRNFPDLFCSQKKQGAK